MTPEEIERAAFERAFCDRVNLARLSTGQYADHNTEMIWCGWLDGAWFLSGCDPRNYPDADTSESGRQALESGE